MAETSWKLSFALDRAAMARAEEAPGSNGPRTYSDRSPRRQVTGRLRHPGL